MYELAHGEAKRHSNEMVQKSLEFDKEKRKHEARKHREAIDKLVEYETDSDDEHGLETDNVKGLKIIPNNTTLINDFKSRQSRVKESTQQSILDENTEYNEKQMLIRIFRKYRQGLNRLFCFTQRKYGRLRW